MQAKTFDRKFDAGEEIVDQLDLSRARRVGTDPRRVNLDFPVWMVDSLDREARRIGITRQSLIKLWLADRLPNRFEQKTLGGICTTSSTQRRAGPTSPALWCLGR